MSRRSIAGRLDYAALTRRDQHRPQTRDEMRAAVAELVARGLTARDIAQSLSLSETAVRQLLGETARTTQEIR